MPFGSGAGFTGSFQGFQRPQGVSLNYTPELARQQFVPQAGADSGGLQAQTDYFAKLAADRAAATQQQPQAGMPDMAALRNQMGYMGISQDEFNKMYQQQGPNTNMGYTGVGYYPNYNPQYQSFDPRYNQARTYDTAGGNM